MEIRTNIDSAGGGNTDAASTVDQDQSNLLSSRVVVSVWLAVGIGVLVIWLGLPDLGRIWPGDPMTYFGLAIQGTTRISLILLVVLAKSVVDYQRRGSKHFYSGTIISLGLWAVLGGLWFVFSFLSAFGDNPQNGFEQELIGPAQAAAAVLLILGIVLVPSARGFVLDRRSRTRTEFH